MDSLVVPNVAIEGASYNYMGCYTDPGPGTRTLNGNSTYYDAPSVEGCANFCANYTYMGLEAGGECYCGNTLDNGAALADCQNECYQSCEDGGSERCGGYFRLSLYQLNGLNFTDPSPSAICSYNGPATVIATSSKTHTYHGPITTASAVTQVVTINSAGLTTTFPSSRYFCEGGCEPDANDPATSMTRNMSPSSTASALPTVQARINRCNYIGCYSDNGGYMALDYLQAQVASNVVSQELCVNQCILGGYPYAGVEFGKQCFCGWHIGPSSSLVSNGQVAADGLTLVCNDPLYSCTGNRTEQCGGFVTIDIWQCPLDASASIASTSSASSTSTTDSTSKSAIAGVAIATGASRIVQHERQGQPQYWSNASLSDRTILKRDSKLHP
ncbi:hypothetical protein LTR86_003350 [Recurvomyces mirabilis]|nr:hypothetical protein LTR86_003350 [Recurvomyces mirabilis]